MIDVNSFLFFQVHGTAGGHKAGDGIAASVAEFLTFLESLVGLTAEEIFGIIMPGINALANVHPLFVHFPIAFLVAFLILDFTGSLLRNDNWRQLAGGLLYLGTITAAATVVAGLMAEATVEHGENVHLILQKHKYIGISVLCISLFLSIWRLLSGGIIKGAANVLYLLIAIILNILIMLGADLGGLMVYKYGVAVEAVEVSAMDYFHEHTHSH